jgi:hypothetical protein
MRKRIRRVWSTLVTLVVLVIVGVLLAALFANRAVRAAAERAGTKALNVNVAIGRANASLFQASVDLKNIRAANPPGYDGPCLLTLPQVDVTADARSLLSKEVLIREIKLDGMEVFVEQKGVRNNLYEVIQPLREPHPPTGKKLIVETLDITNVTVHVGLTGLPGQARAAEFQLPPIRLTDLGRGEHMDTEALIVKIVLAIAAGVAEQAGDILPQETLGDLTSLLDKALDLGRIIFGPSENSGDTQKDGDLGKTITEGLKGIIGSPKKE